MDSARKFGHRAPVDARARLRELIDTPELGVETLFELFDALEPIETEFMLGEWDGGAFSTGHPGEQQLAALGWVGKVFRGLDDVDPIIVRNEAGERELSSVMGSASLRAVAYRGALTATMIYDRHPIFDHFRKIDDDTVLGVMDRKGDPFELFFYLRRLA